MAPSRATIGPGVSKSSVSLPATYFLAYLLGLRTELDLFIFPVSIDLHAVGLPIAIAPLYDSLSLYFFNQITLSLYSIVLLGPP